MDLRAAADRLGVHYQTAYRWVRDGSLDAVKIGSSYEVDEAAVERLGARRRQPSPPPPHTRVRDWRLQSQRFQRLLLTGDELGARAMVERLHEGGIEPVTLCEELISPALRAIGEQWSDGYISIAHEHRASGITERLLARIAVHPRGRPRGVAVVATPPGEEHGLPSVMATVALRGDRWQVHHLGTEVPAPDLIDLAKSVEADLVVLSMVNPAAVRSEDDVAGQVRAAGYRVLEGRPGMTLRQLILDARAH